MTDLRKEKRTPLSIQEAFSDKTIFVIGVTGFLGKVWLTMLLSKITSFKKMYILIRGKGSQSAQDRFEQLINSSYVFAPLHQQFGSGLSDYLRQKVEVLEGDVEKENLGLSDDQIGKLLNEADLTVNFAGLVDFNPDLREAFSINIQGTINVADFVRRCRHKKLVHVSTCYVAGTREGYIKENVLTNESPSGKPLDIDNELQWIQSSINSLLKEYNSEEQLKLLKNMIHERNVDSPISDQKLNKTIENLKRKKTREGLTKLGVDRSAELGWTNIYTYTKGLGEIVLKQKYADLNVVIFRPSIVESALSFPFPGWNEGFNTSGPLAYLMKTWFRHLPLKKGNPFDVIPVDFVSRGLMIACAALLKNVEREVYHCSTSDKNQLTIDKACEYTSESHSQWYKQNGEGWRERMILSRWKTIPSRKDHPLSTPNMKKVFNWIEKVLSKTQTPTHPLKPLFKSLYRWSLRSNRKLEQTEKLLQLFYPFIHDYRHIFETRSLFLYNVKEKDFEFSIQKISWPDYWHDIQMPGLRKWCFPVIEGKSVEKFTPAHPFLISGTTNGSVKAHGNGKSNGKTYHPSVNVDLQTTPAFQQSISEKKVNK